ncbi:Mitochondrial import inner membrane translocase subunit TIM44 [Ophiophagus hannah]|uniref:Mitochondrial import inner membrane translocase subunit TIM44 n=1 Tax=Ophiophagus hannah TaxID=8665 RepID=V8N543_OPHHA|nr:Mitochondrial import inner membrane translocase subunit TIM44 [Ophiophagus hannah]
MESVRKEIDESVLGQTGPYRRPERLRKRTESAGERLKDERIFEANEAGGPYSFFQGYLSVFLGFFEMKMKYDESDNALIRASRVMTDKVTDFIGLDPEELNPYAAWRLLDISASSTEQIL